MKDEWSSWNAVVIIGCITKKFKEKHGKTYEHQIFPSQNWMATVIIKKIISTTELKLWKEEEFHK